MSESPLPSFASSSSFLSPSPSYSKMLRNNVKAVARWHYICSSLREPDFTRDYCQYHSVNFYYCIPKVLLPLIRATRHDNYLSFVLNSVCEMPNVVNEITQQYCFGRYAVQENNVLPLSSSSSLFSPLSSSLFASFFRPAKSFVVYEYDVNLDVLGRYDGKGNPISLGSTCISLSKALSVEKWLSGFLLMRHFKSASLPWQNIQPSDFASSFSLPSSSSFCSPNKKIKLSLADSISINNQYEETDEEQKEQEEHEHLNQTSQTKKRHRLSSSSSSVPSFFPVSPLKALEDHIKQKESWKITDMKQAFPLLQSNLFINSHYKLRAPSNSVQESSITLDGGIIFGQDLPAKIALSLQLMQAENAESENETEKKEKEKEVLLNFNDATLGSVRDWYEGSVLKNNATLILCPDLGTLDMYASTFAKEQQSIVIRNSHDWKKLSYQDLKGARVVIVRTDFLLHPEYLKTSDPFNCTFETRNAWQIKSHLKCPLFHRFAWHRMILIEPTTYSTSLFEAVDAILAFYRWISVFDPFAFHCSKNQFQNQIQNQNKNKSSSKSKSSMKTKIDEGFLTNEQERTIDATLAAERMLTFLNVSVDGVKVMRHPRFSNGSNIEKMLRSIFSGRSIGGSTGISRQKHHSYPFILHPFMFQIRRWMFSNVFFHANENKIENGKLVDAGKIDHMHIQVPLHPMEELFVRCRNTLKTSWMETSALIYPHKDVEIVWRRDLYGRSFSDLIFNEPSPTFSDKLEHVSVNYYQECLQKHIEATKLRILDATLQVLHDHMLLFKLFSLAYKERVCDKTYSITIKRFLPPIDNEQKAFRPMVVPIKAQEGVVNLSNADERSAFQRDALLFIWLSRGDSFCALLKLLFDFFEVHTHLFEEEMDWDGVPDAEKRPYLHGAECLEADQIDDMCKTLLFKFPIGFHFSAARHRVWHMHRSYNVNEDLTSWFKQMCEFLSDETRSLTRILPWWQWIHPQADLECLQKQRTKIKDLFTHLRDQQVVINGIVPRLKSNPSEQLSSSSASSLKQFTAVLYDTNYLSNTMNTRIFDARSFAAFCVLSSSPPQWKLPIFGHENKAPIMHQTVSYPSHSFAQFGSKAQFIHSFLFENVEHSRLILYSQNLDLIRFIKGTMIEINECNIALYQGHNSTREKLINNFNASSVHSLCNCDGLFSSAPCLNHSVSRKRGFKRCHTDHRALFLHSHQVLPFQNIVVPFKLVMLDSVVLDFEKQVEKLLPLLRTCPQFEHIQMISFAMQHSLESHIFMKDEKNELENEEATAIENENENEKGRKEKAQKENENQAEKIKGLDTMDLD